MSCWALLSFCWNRRGGPGSGGLWRPVSRNCGPYKNMIDQICCLGAGGGCLELLALGLAELLLDGFEGAGGGRGGLGSGGLWRPVARNCGPYKKIIDQIRSIQPWLLEA